MGTIEIAIVLLLTSPCVFGREEVKFDFGWKFHLGDLTPSWSCPAGSFPQNRSGVQCLGLKSDPAKSADECMSSCCGDVMCSIWQYAADQGCWVGSSDDCKHPSKDWAGGERTVPAKPPPPSKGGPTSRNFNDSDWEVVDVPHDAIISVPYSQDGPKSHGYIPQNVTWYRKHFNLPAEWKGNIIWVYFEGVFRASTVYMNGQMLGYHDSGYTSFTVRLDNCTQTFYGDGPDNENVIVVRADATRGTGWWYEGGGIYRPTHLISAPFQHVITNGLYGVATVNGTIKQHDPSDSTKGMYTDLANLHLSAEVANDDSKAAVAAVQFTIFDQDGKSLLTLAPKGANVDALSITKVVDTAPFPNVELWSINRPYLYTLQSQVMVNSVVVDAMNVTFGVREATWDPDAGFYLNGASFIWRGFNNHNDFTGVGVAVPDRVNLFRAQAMRAVGANSWRMSHNPPVPVLLDIMDRVGVIVWDENRNFGDNPIWVTCQGDMVKRDRNHPSIMAWSFCNEGGCNLSPSTTEDKAAQEFKKASNDVDQFRPVTANQVTNGLGDSLSSAIDVQGFSHVSGSAFDNYHKQFPKKPLIGSECCSCRTQRGEDVASSSKSNPHFGNFNADCNQEQTGRQLNRKFVAGCMVWTLFDYYGEPTPYGWPMVSSSFGSIDLAGFAKASAYWYRAWWLYSASHNKSLSGEDYPWVAPKLVDPKASLSKENATAGYIIHIVQSWEPSGSPQRTIQAYTNAPMAELFVDGKSQGIKSPSWQGWAQWDNVQFVSAPLKATAMDTDKGVQASHTVEPAGKASKVQAYLDSPSPDTGTGSKLVLDGQDAGMVGAAIVDDMGHVVPSSSHNVTFSIVKGPGRIIGVGNGDPSCHQPNKASWRNAYHGLARAIVQVTVDASSHPLHRHRLRQIDCDGGLLTPILPPEADLPLDSEIVVQASVEGLGSAQVSIPVTSDSSSHGVLAVASAGPTYK